MICKKCGTQLPDIARFCFMCGVAVDGKDTEESEKKELETQDAPQQKSDDAVPEQTVSKAEEPEEEDEEPGGYKIMVNPDYVPPENDEDEAPLFEEHIDYQAIYREKSERAEKIIMKVGTVVGVIAAIVIVGVIGFRLVTAHQFNSAMDEAKSLYESEDYDAAISRLNEALDLYGADKTEVGLELSKAYIAKGDIEGAQEAVLKLYNETGDGDLYAEYNRVRAFADEETTNADDTTDVADDNANDDKYQEMVAKINSELEANDYTAALNSCKEALNIDSSVEDVYLLYAQAYAGLGDYTNSAQILKTGIDKLNEAGKNVSSDYKTEYNKYSDIVAQLNEYSEFCSKLYQAMSGQFSNGVVKESVELILSDDFDKASKNAEATYYIGDKGFVDSISFGTGMAIYNNGYVYYGSFANGKRSGTGLFMAAQEDETVGIKYSVFKGTWSNGLPNGSGSVTYVEGYGTDKVSTSVTSGTYADGYEDGTMSRSKTVEGTKWGVMEYNVSKGVPQAMKDGAGKEATNKNGKRILGYHYFNGKPTHIVTIVEGALFGIDGLGLDMTQ